MASIMTKLDTVWAGTTLTIKVYFKNSTGSLVDPGTVTFRAQDPDEALNVYTYGEDNEVLRAEAGVYVATITYDVPGVWTVGFEGVSGTTTIRSVYRIEVIDPEIFD